MYLEWVSKWVLIRYKFCKAAVFYGLEIGWVEQDGPLLSVEEISNILAVNENLNFSIMMTSCFLEDG